MIKTFNLKNLSLSIIGLILSAMAMAQNTFSISGSVVNEAGDAMSGATVYINGSSHLMASSKEGKFLFANIAPGSYQVSVLMLGHHPYSQNVAVINKSEEVKLTLKINPTALKEVVIKHDPNWEKNYALFKRELLGDTDNGRACQLLDDGGVKLQAGNIYLYATADDFLTVINTKFGYRIKVRLKKFSHTLGTNSSWVDTETVFEELEGTDAMKREWGAAREVRYKNSMRRFLRALYNNKVLEEGFVVRERFPPPLDALDLNLLYVSNQPVKMDSLTKRVNDAFISFAFKNPLYVNWEPEIAAALKLDPGKNRERPMKRAVSSTLLDSNGGTAYVDRAGNCINCWFGRNGAWGLERVGDQLPSDYDPNRPVKNLQ